MTAAEAADDLELQARRLADAGIRSLAVVTWRDLDAPGAGGSELHINRLAECWVDAGLAVTIYTGRPPGAAPSSRRGQVRVMRQGGRAGALVHGPRAARGSQADAVVETWHGFNFLAPAWTRGRPLISIAHHVHQEQFDHLLPVPIARAAALVERRLYPRLYRSTSLVTLSDSTRRELEALGYRHDQITVAEPGVDSRFFPGAKSAHPLIVTVSRLMPQKRADAVIDALIDVKRHVPDLEAVVAGAGPELAALRQKVAAAGHTAWLHLPGRVSDDEQVRLYQEAWAVVSASASEGWGMSLSEAAACATAAVASDITGHRDIVVDGVTGYVASGTSMSDRLRTLAEDRELAVRMGEAARQHIAPYSWPRCAARTLSAFRLPSPPA